MRYKIFSILLLISCFAFVAKADEEVRFTARAPQSVIMEQPFQIVYEVHNGSGKDFRAPEFNNFDVLAGPFTSTSSQLQIINGKQSSSTKVSYTFTLQPQKNGTFSIGPASITIKGEKYSSNGLSIKVLPADSKTNQGQQEQEGQRRQTQQSDASTQINSDNIFIRTQLSKTNVYEQEAILLTYKLYTTLDVVQCGAKKMPDFNGFMKQDIEQPTNKQFAYENLDGKNYVAVTLNQILLYPQQSGTIKIDPASFEAIIQVQNKRASRSIFDDFFGSYSNVSRNITAPGVTVNVKSLPEGKPVSFSGAVGQFDLKSSITNEQTKANEAVTLKITISGSGNMKMIKTPEVNFPNGFELYDPKVANNFKTAASGVSGTKTIEYLFIPRQPGNYEIPSVEFSYFDTKSNSYKTLKTPVYKLNVQKGDASDAGVITGGNFANKEDIRQLGRDIRYINTSDIKLIKEQTPLFGTVSSWLMYLIPLFAALVLFFIFRKQAKDNSDIRLVRNKKANKVAIKRLKQAQKLLVEGKKDLFYEEVMKSVWNYLSDKLGMSVAELSKESVRAQLTSLGVDENSIQKVNDILNTCEFARFAPNTGQEEMGHLYDDTIELISHIEDLLKTRRK